MQAQFSRHIARNLTNTRSFGAFFEPIFQIVKSDYRRDAHKCIVTGVRWESNSVLTIQLLMQSSKWRNFRAGQFVPLFIEHNGAMLQRTFSVASSPTRFRRTGMIELSIRVHENGRVTPLLSEYSGKTVYIGAAQGEFTMQALPQPLKPMLFIAGGIGITPILSMLRELDAQNALASHALCFYVRNINDAPFIAELRHFESQGLKLWVIETPKQGHFSISQLDAFCPDFGDHRIYLCGPPAMIGSVRDKFLERGIPDDQLCFEYFGSAPLNRTGPNTSESLESNKLKSPVTIQFRKSGSTVDIHNKLDRQLPLLDIAERQQLNPVAGCRIGVCHQCICQKQSGRVRNLRTGAISDSGPEEIQLCISQAIDDVIIDL